MRFRTLAAILGAAALMVCSCEKHHVGEMPEVQREKGQEAEAHGAHGAGGHHEAAGESGEKHSSMDHAKPTPTPTAAEFFPTKP